MPSGPKSALTNHQKVCVETNKPLMATGKKRKGHPHAEQLIYEEKEKSEKNKIVVMLELSFFEFLQKIEKSLLKWAFCVHLEKQHPSHTS